MINVTFDGQLLFGAAALVIALTGLLAQWRLGRKIDDVKHEVVTGNDRTIGQLETSKETRRVRTIPAAERTAREQRHEDWAEKTGEE